MKKSLSEEAQKANQKRGDFVQLIEDDFRLLHIFLQEEEIKSMDNIQFQTQVKCAMKQSAFIRLQEIQQAHSKYKNVKHTSLKIQP